MTPRSENVITPPLPKDISRFVTLKPKSAFLPKTEHRAEVVSRLV